MTDYLAEPANQRIISTILETSSGSAEREAAVKALCEVAKEVTVVIFADFAALGYHLAGETPQDGAYDAVSWLITKAEKLKLYDQSKGSLRQWLYRVLKNYFTDRYRKRFPKVDVLIDDESSEFFENQLLTEKIDDQITEILSQVVDFMKNIDADFPRAKGVDYFAVFLLLFRFSLFDQLNDFGMEMITKIEHWFPWPAEMGNRPIRNDLVTIEEVWNSIKSSAIPETRADRFRLLSELLSSDDLDISVNCIQQWQSRSLRIIREYTDNEVILSVIDRLYINKKKSHATE